MDTSTRITTRLQGKLGELWLKRMWTGITFSILIMVLGVAAGCSSGSDEEATQPQILVKTSAKWLPPPTSMDELIGDADVIAIGRVGPVIREVEEGGWDQNGQPTEGILHTHTYYQLELEEVIRDDGTVASGEPVLLRMLRSLQTGRGAEDKRRSDSKDHRVAICDAPAWPAEAVRAFEVPQWQLFYRRGEWSTGH